MKRKGTRNTGEKSKPQEIEVSEKQIEIFARRLLPEIKKFFADEEIRKEFEEWKEKKKSVDVK